MLEHYKPAALSLFCASSRVSCCQVAEISQTLTSLKLGVSFLPFWCWPCNWPKVPCLHLCLVKARRCLSVTSPVLFWQVNPQRVCSFPEALLSLLLESLQLLNSTAETQIKLNCARCTSYQPCLRHERLSVSVNSAVLCRGKLPELQ